jgi:6-phosphogluconolactonase
MMEKGNVKIFESKGSLAHFFGQLLMERTANDGKVTIALSGGSTPRAIFDELSESFADKISWDKVCLFWGDERCVSPTDRESNYKMTKDHLLSKVSIPEGQVYRVEGELEPGEAAKNYERVLKEVLPLNKDLPEFDIMLLGMGDDGHTASVFPYEIELWDKKELCVVATHPVSGQKRVSLTGDVINNSKEIYFLVTGENKAEKLDEILNRKAGFEKYPAAKVDNPIWLVDNDAARLL